MPSKFLWLKSLVLLVYINGSMDITRENFICYQELSIFFHIGIIQNLHYGESMITPCTNSLLAFWLERPLKRWKFEYVGSFQVYAPKEAVKRPSGPH